CTRPFVEAAFSFRPLERYCEPLHYSLTRYLCAELHGLPYEFPWRSQTPAVVYAGAVLRYWWDRMPGYRLRKKLEDQLMKLKGGSAQKVGQVGLFDWPRWLEAKRDWVRDLCLGQRDSILWSFVKRPALERLLSPNTNPNERADSYVMLYSIAT